jgi:hypothetical protein
MQNYVAQGIDLSANALDRFALQPSARGGLKALQYNALTGTAGHLPPGDS